MANKYGARKVQRDGYVFDSKREAARYEELRLLQIAGRIGPVSVHEPRVLLMVNGWKIGYYTPDFSYFDYETHQMVYEDVKSAPTRTRDYVMRKKLIRALHGIEIRETE